MATRRVNVSLDQEHASKLSRLAERAHVSDGTLARSLLTSALDEADPDPAHVTDLLDAIPGAFEDAELGRRQADRGQTIDLEDL